MRLSTLWRPLALPLLVALLAGSAQAQTPILTEDFTATTFPPAGWATFASGSGTTVWTRIASTSGGATPAFARSTFTAVPVGTTEIEYFASPAVAVPAGGARVAFTMFQTYTAAYNSQYRVAIATASQTTPTDYTTIASWNESTACPGGSGAPPAVAPTTVVRNCSLTLPAAYNGQTVYVAFIHENNDGDNFNLDNVLVETIPTNPIFALSPSTAQDFGTAGPCVTPSVARTFTVSNSGAGTLQLQGVTFASGGSAAFTLAGTTTASLAVGQSASFTVTFAPGAGTTGAQTASLQVNYNAGAGAQTATVALTGTATAASASGGSSAGYAFANAATGACASANPAPAGTGFISIAGHTQITTWTDDGVTGGDDSYFLLDIATLDGLVGSVRLFGNTYETFYINSNGYLNSTASGFVIGTLPVATFGDVVSALGQDLDIRTGTFDASDPGQYPVATYYGLADGDGDGAADDLVVTWFHAYDYFSTPVLYTNPAAAYATFQIVVIKSDRPNQEDRFEVRFPAGNDANGIPYSRNTAAGTGGATSLENDALVGIGNAAGTTSVEYREDTAGGPIFLAGGAANAVRFTAETQATATGVAGYRTMGAPVTGYTVGRLAGLNLVQSVVGQYPTFASDNVYTFDGTAYVAAANVTDALAPGRGFLWYLFNINRIPANPADGAGTSRSYTLPMALQGTGQTPSAAVAIPLTATGAGFNLVANPFRASLTASPTAIASWAVGGTLASAVPQAYNPATGSFTIGLPGGVATAWQGFFIQNSTAGGATSLSVPTTAQTTGGTFVGLTADAPTGVLAFRLDGTDAATGAATIDVAAALAVSAEMGTDGWDLLDASKLAPFVTTYATVGFQGVGPDGQPAVKAQESRPPTAEAFDVPLVVDAVGTAPALSLSWAGLDALPATWGLELRDLVTGAVVDMRTTAAYAFEHTADPAVALAPEAILARTTTAAQAKATDAPRFVLHVTTGRTTATEGGAITEFALAAPAPNPTAGAAVVSFDVPEASAVSVAVYDLLGRRVAVLAEGEMAAGRHTARLEAGALAPGVYVVRMQAGTFSAVRRVTVVR